MRDWISFSYGKLLQDIHLFYLYLEVGETRPFLGQCLRSWWPKFLLVCFWLNMAPVIFFCKIPKIHIAYGGLKSFFFMKIQCFWQLITHNTHISKLRSIFLFSFEYLSSVISKNMVTIKWYPNGDLSQKLFYAYFEIKHAFWSSNAYQKHNSKLNKFFCLFY